MNAPSLPILSELIGDVHIFFISALMISKDTDIDNKDTSEYNSLRKY